jgi:hypothetical protein
MEQLQIKAARFRKQGRLQDEDVEEIIKEIKDKDQITNEEEGRRDVDQGQTAASTQSSPGKPTTDTWQGTQY